MDMDKPRTIELGKIERVQSVNSLGMCTDLNVLYNIKNGESFIFQYQFEGLTYQLELKRSADNEHRYVVSLATKEYEFALLGSKNSAHVSMGFLKQILTQIQNQKIANCKELLFEYVDEVYVKEDVDKIRRIFADYIKSGNKIAYFGDLSPEETSPSELFRTYDSMLMRNMSIDTSFGTRVQEILDKKIHERMSTLRRITFAKAIRSTFANGNLLEVGGNHLLTF